MSTSALLYIIQEKHVCSLFNYLIGTINILKRKEMQKMNMQNCVSIIISITKDICVIRIIHKILLRKFLKKHCLFFICIYL